MALRIEDYALVGDCQTAALVGRDGSIDWLCLPRFDSGACFAALLGTPDNGRWLLAPEQPAKRITRRYVDDTLVLETTFETESGAASVTDFMTLREGPPELIRIVEGKSGEVRMQMELVIRFDYGSVIPWVQRAEGGIVAVAGPHTLRVLSPVDMRVHNFKTEARFTVREGQKVPFNLTWFPSHRTTPTIVDCLEAQSVTEKWWRDWSSQCTYAGEWRDTVVRSLITLKALTYRPTGGIVAAPTTSLPEKMGGVRNWDYRFCWLRDATFTLQTLMDSGYVEEARAWREWLLRAVAGTPEQVQIMYGLSGERRLTEIELGWLPGYEGSAPVRIGNGAYGQAQLDVFGEVMDTMYQCRRVGLDPSPNAWNLQRVLLQHLETVWDKPDSGLWEIRGPERRYTYSEIMAWVAMDRAVKEVEQFGMEGPVDRWRALRQKIRDEVCRKGYDSDQGTFVQSYGSKELDASLLLIPVVGFLPASDPRVRGTVAAIRRHLTTPEGFVYRYRAKPEVDHLPAGEGAFLLCTFWLVDSLALAGEWQEARRLFENVLSVRNDVGLVSESYDIGATRLVGNFPQAYSHVGLVNSAHNLTSFKGPAEQRSGG